MELMNLSYLGLTEGEVRVYQALLENGPLSAAQIIEKTKLKKGDCYNKVYDLVQKGLIEEYEERKKKHFRLLDPRRLDELTANQYQTAVQAKREIEAVLPNILSAYTLSHHRPGIMMFEGEEAVRRTLEDSLATTTPILSYVDAKAARQYFPEINKQYVSKRSRLGVYKKMLVSDNEFNRHYFAQLDPRASEVRLMSYKLPDFQVSMQIYDNKISYLTLKSEAIVGIIIEDSAIALMHRSLFESQWQLAQPYPANSGVQKRQ